MALLCWYKFAVAKIFVPYTAKSAENVRQAFPQSADGRLGNIPSNLSEGCVESPIALSRPAEVCREVETLSLATPAVHRRCS